MTTISRMRHRIDINNPTWAAGSKTDHWTNYVRAFVIEAVRTVRNSRGAFVRSNITAVVEPETDVNNDSEIRFGGSVYPVIGLSKLRRSRSDQVKHIEVYA